MSVQFTHIYNRGNNGQKIFFESRNYSFFLQKLKRHLTPNCSILAYCFMPNHFHILAVNNPSDGSQKTMTTPSGGSKPSGGFEIQKAIGIILGSYTQGVNKAFNRTGSLFQQQTKLKYTEDYKEATIIFHYIHQNPLKAGLVSKMEDWEYSSFNSYLNANEGIIDRNSAYNLLDIATNKDSFYKDAYGVINFKKFDPPDGLEPPYGNNADPPEGNVPSDGNNADPQEGNVPPDGNNVDPPDGLEPPDGNNGNNLNESEEPNKAIKIGLVLSGGGVRGVAHLGIIKALEEKKIKFDVISSTSAGSIIGALYSYGYTVEEILKIITEIKAFRLLQPALSWTGLLNMEVVERFLKVYLPIDNFSSLKIPLYIAATNLNSGKTEYFNSGKLRAAICASSCIPVLFNPVKYNGNLYIDGGVLNNLPVEPIRDQCEIVIGCHSNPVGPGFEAKNAKGVMERALMMAITKNAYQNKPKCDIFIEPDKLAPFKVLDLNRAKDIFHIGYEHASKQLEKENLNGLFAK